MVPGVERFVSAAEGGADRGSVQMSWGETVPLLPGSTVMEPAMPPRCDIAKEVVPSDCSKSRYSEDSGSLSKNCSGAKSKRSEVRSGSNVRCGTSDGAHWSWSESIPLREEL